MDRETEQAMAWLHALKAPAPGQEEAFVDWVRASPAHLQEFLMAAAVNEELGALDWSAMPGVEAALHRATSNVIQLPAAHAERPAPARETRPRWRRAACAAAVAAGVALWWLPDGQTYRTAIGEQRQVELADHSVVNLNSRSRMELRFSPQAREVLLEGEALFKVQPDPARPFRVISGAAEIQVLGTQFNVRSLPSGTIVSVLEGAVRVTAGGAVELAAGEEARIGLDGRVDTRTLADRGAGAWQRNRLVFRDNTLEDIVAEFNRWNARQIYIEGGPGAGQLYDGAFDADDPQSLIDFLRRTPGLKVVEEKGRLIVRPR